MQIPAKDVYVIPTGSDFIACDKQNMQKMIVIILSNEGIIFVNPFAMLVKVLSTNFKRLLRRQSPHYFYFALAR